MKCFITAIFSLVLSETLCMPLFSGYAESDSENLLIPYRNTMNEFNNSHGTTYSFMTDEQLSTHNIDRDEYSQKSDISADTMPYYI